MLEDVAAHAQGQQFIVLPPQDWDWRQSVGSNRGVDFGQDLRRIKQSLGATPISLAAWSNYSGEDRARLAALAELSAQEQIAMVATNAVRLHAPQRRRLGDVLACVRAGKVINEAGFIVPSNAERHIKSPAAMARLFGDYPAALTRSVEIARACTFSLDELVYEYPDEPVPAGLEPDGHLADLTWAGAAEVFPDGIPARVAATIKRELALIAQMKYVPYFLTVYDIVRFARGRGILCQGAWIGRKFGGLLLSWDHIRQSDGGRSAV